MMVNYLLTHSFAKDKDSYDVKFKSNLRVTYLSNIIAYIQFLTDDIKHASELSAIETVMILKMFYDESIELLDDDVDCKFIIDEYENWEFYCGVADKLLNDQEYQRDGLSKFIEKLLLNQESLIDVD